MYKFSVFIKLATPDTTTPLTLMVLELSVISWLIVLHLYEDKQLLCLLIVAHWPGSESVAARERTE